MEICLNPFPLMKTSHFVAFSLEEMIHEFELGSHSDVNDL